MSQSPIHLSLPPLMDHSGGGNEDSLTKSVSASQHAVFVFPRDAVINAVLKATSTSLLPPDGLFWGAKERTFPPRLCRPRQIIPGTTKCHHRSSAIPTQTAPPPPPTDAPSPVHHASSPPMDNYVEDGLSIQDKRPSRPEHPARRPLPR